jgi:hypothetical protein
LIYFCKASHYYSSTVKVPVTVNVAILADPSGAGDVVTVFVPGATVTVAVDGALKITVPDPPAKEGPV